jgi:hypothetical protein
MTNATIVPEKKWSIVGLGAAGAFAVIVSYVLFLALAVACLSLPVIIFSSQVRYYAVAAVLLSIFGIVAGLTTPLVLDTSAG